MKSERNYPQFDKEFDRSTKEIEDVLSYDNLAALSQVEHLLRIALERIRDSIDRGEYGLVIGDDASGRIPTLIVGEVLKKLYSNRGFIFPKIRFIAGSTGLGPRAREEKKSRVAEFIGSIKDEFSGRVLIVTDTINSGSSVSVLKSALQENKIDSDVITLGAIKDFRKSVEDERVRLEKQLGGAVGVGGGGEPKLYRQQEMHGVSKNPADLFAHTISGSRDVIVAVRDMAHVIADRLVLNFEKHRQQEAS